MAGCGNMARTWFRAIDQLQLAGLVIDVVGLVDTDLVAAERLRGEVSRPEALIGRDLDAMLVACQPDILLDVVVPDARHEVVTTGLGRGCHVLSEKPMAPSLDEARKLVRCAAQAGLVHAIVQNRRYVSGVRRIRQTIEAGILGELTAIHADFFIGAHFGGFREAMRHPLLLDMAIHTFDAARFMTGERPLAVYCLETNPSGSWFADGAAANAIFEMSRGVVFTYRGSWVAEGARTSWESTWRVIGTRGTLTWDGADRLEAEVVVSNNGFLRGLQRIEVPMPADPSTLNGHASILEAFVTAIDRGTVPETVGSDNIKSLEMVFGAIESARGRARVLIASESE